jgi:hypothetical protein
MIRTTHQSLESKPVPDTTVRLMDQKVLSHADNRLAPHLPLEAEGYACTTDDLLKVLLGVAANQGTSESVCADLLGTPDRTPHQMRCPYRRCFGIENSYRCAGQARGWTISPSSAYRLPHARPELRVAEYLRAHMLVRYPREGHCTSGMEGKLGCVR